MNRLFTLRSLANSSSLQVHRCDFDADRPTTTGHNP